MDDYAKNGGPREVCSFCYECFCTWIKTIANKFAISNHKALILGVHALKSFLKLICEYEFHSLPNKKVSSANDHGKNYIEVIPPLVRHLLRNRRLDKHGNTLLHLKRRFCQFTEMKKFTSLRVCLSSLSFSATSVYFPAPLSRSV